jgi:hypothetical protein
MNLIARKMRGPTLFAPGIVAHIGPHRAVGPQGSGDAAEVIRQQEVDVVGALTHPPLA